MNEKIKKGKFEYDEKNFKKALSYFEDVAKDDYDYDCAVLYRISCLMKLKRYAEALKFINLLIEKNPYDDLLWFDKAACHMFLEEDEKALNALGEIERIVDVEDKVKLLHVARLYNWLCEEEKALKYCDMALAIDENYKEALYEKSQVAVGLKDDRMMNEVADKLSELTNDDLLSLMPIFLLRLFSKNYRGCIELIRAAKTDDDTAESIGMFKAGLYNKICEDLCAQILVSHPVDLSIDDAINLMIDFQESGKDHGEIKGAQYFIL